MAIIEEKLAKLPDLSSLVSLAFQNGSEYWYAESAFTVQ